nr:ATP-dependent DNA helicase RecQ [Bacillus sp. REN3]
MQKYFHFQDFRPGQYETIQSILDRRHTLAMLPTGTGKSLCYQLPGYLSDGTVLIVSPLLSLMQDQVEQMMARGEKRVIALNSFLTPPQRNEALTALEAYKFIFISPEMLGSETVVNRLRTLRISLFAVDEAHCISQWGYDFRPDYLNLGKVRQLLGNPLTLALTATANYDVRRDIGEKLLLHDWNEVVFSVDRPSISISVEQASGFQEKLERLKELAAYLNGPGIIYFSSKKMAEQTAAYLREHGIRKVMAYHGGLDPESRVLIQQQFINGQLDIICATSAFGMGINKENVRYVIHFHMPMQIESYLQEIGRAARDGREAVAILLYTPGDEQLQFQLAEAELPNGLQIDRLFTYLSEKKLHYRDVKLEEELISVFCGFTEIQWRIVEDYLSNLKTMNMEQDQAMLKGMLEERLKIKNGKILKMLEWVLSNECKRAGILAAFDEELPSGRKNCCSHCGLVMNHFKKEATTEAEHSHDREWKQVLASILLNK